MDTGTTTSWDDCLRFQKFISGEAICNICLHRSSPTSLPQYESDSKNVSTVLWRHTMLLSVHRKDSEVVDRTTGKQLRSDKSDPVSCCDRRSNRSKMQSCDPNVQHPEQRISAISANPQSSNIRHALLFCGDYEQKFKVFHPSVIESEYLGFDIDWHKRLSTNRPPIGDAYVGSRSDLKIDAITHTWRDRESGTERREGTAHLCRNSIPRRSWGRSCGSTAGWCSVGIHASSLGNWTDQKVQGIMGFRKDDSWIDLRLI